MKKLISVFISMVMVVCVFSACGKGESGKDSGKLSIVTTIFPEYDWVREITKGNDNVEITMLLDKGVDLHSFEPTAEDIAKVSTCDVFIYVGGESDEWVEDALAEAINKDMVVINLLDVMGDSVKEEEVVEGMQDEEEEAAEEESEEVEYDEHVWLSVKNAEIFSQKIADELSRVDSKNAELYSRNAEEYISKLESLDKEYEDVVEAASQKTVVFGDRFPFRYLVDDYGLEYYAAFVGCSAETEASFETISFLAGKVDELELKSILQIETSDGKISETIKDNTKDKNQQILTMDSMQSVTSQDVDNGANYLEIMQSNLEELKKALK